MKARRIFRIIFLTVGLCCVAHQIWHWSNRWYYTRNKGCQVAKVGDKVEVCVNSEIGTGTVVRVSTEWDEKYGTYTRYHVDFGVEASGEREIHSFPYRFVKRIP